VPEPRADRRSTAWLALAAAALLAAVTFGRTVVENDLFWHLAIGRHLAGHGFPTTDPFGIGTEGLSWSPPEWLSELALFEAFRLGGLGALGVVHTLFLTALGALVFFRARVLTEGPHGSVHALFAVALTALPASVHLGIRPLLVGHLLSALVLLELARERRGLATLVPVLPLVFVLWANLHPSWPLGVGWIALEVIGRLVSSPLARRWPERFAEVPVSRPVSGALALSPLAALARPDGVDGFLYPFVHVIGLSDRMGEIIEWFPLSPTRPLHVFVVLSCLGTLVLSLRRRVAPPDLLVALASSYLLVRHQRFLPLALVGVAPLLSSVLPAPPATAELRARLTSLPVARALSVVLTVLALVLWPTPAVLEESILVLSPVRAVDALERIDSRSEEEGAMRVLTTFEDGGYVSWRLPSSRVFIDSRFDLHVRAGVFDDYLALRAGGPIAPLAARDRFDAAILPAPARDTSFEHVRRELVDLGWREAFVDENAVLLLAP
jgi:hypothetical protein